MVFASVVLTSVCCLPRLKVQQSESFLNTQGLDQAEKWDIDVAEMHSACDLA